MLIKAEPDFTDGFEGQIALRLVFSGCGRAAEGRPCLNCQNPVLWSFGADDDAKKMRTEALGKIEFWSKTKARFDCISLVGGEPLDQDETEMRFVLGHAGRFCGGVPIFLYTGYTEEEIRSMGKTGHPAVKSALYVKFGQFMDGLPPKGRLASSNQRMTKALRDGDRITFEDISF